MRSEERGEAEEGPPAVGSIEDPTNPTAPPPPAPAPAPVPPDPDAVPDPPLAVLSLVILAASLMEMGKVVMPE